MKDHSPYYALYQFLGGWFHQNWKETHNWKGRKPSFELVVQDFREITSKSNLEQVIQQLDLVIHQNLNEAELSQLVNRILGCGIYAPGLGMTYQGWLDRVRELLEADDPST